MMIEEPVIDAYHALGSLVRAYIISLNPHNHGMR